MLIRELIELSDVLPEEYSVELARYLEQADPDEHLMLRDIEKVVQHMVAFLAEKKQLAPTHESLEYIEDLLEPHAHKVPSEIVHSFRRVVESLPCHDESWDWQTCPHLVPADTGIRRCNTCGYTIEEGPCPNCET